MSYYTKVEVIFWNNDAPDEQFVEQVVAWARNFTGWAPTSGIDANLDMDDLQAALAGNLTEFHGYRDKFEDMFLKISKQFPGAIFAARGFGEEFDDVWVGFFKSGGHYTELPRPEDLGLAP